MIDMWVQRLIKFRRFLGTEVWSLFLVAIFVGTVWFFVELSFVYILQGFLGTLGLAKLENEWLQNFYPTTVLGSCYVVIGFGIFRAATIFMRLYFSLLASQAFQRHQRIRILNHALSHAETESTPEIISIFNDRVSQSSQVIQCIVYLINLLTALTLFSVTAFVIAPIEFIIAFSILGIFMLPFRSLNIMVNSASIGLVEESKKSTRSIILGLRNHYLLRLYGAMDRLINRGAQSLRDYERHYRTYVAVAAAKTAAPHLIGVIAIGAVTYISLMWLNTPGASLLSFFYLFFRIAQSASDGMTYLNEIRVHLAGFKSLYHFNMKVEASAQLDQGHRDIRRHLEIQSLTTNNLAFSWETGAPIFQNVNLSLKRGDVLLIRGESGTGKSTLLAVLTKILSPKEGSVKIDGIPLGEIFLEDLSPSLGYVGPEPYLIEGSIRENLLFAHPNAIQVSDQSILDALESVRLREDILNQPQGLDTILNEYTQLSTGQKQRLSLARAFLRQPKLLVLDEATANLDADTEAKIISAIRQGCANRITIAVSHRSSFDDLATTELTLVKKVDENPAHHRPL